MSYYIPFWTLMVQDILNEKKKKNYLEIHNRIFILEELLNGKLYDY